MPAVAKKGKASDDHIISGTKGKKSKQKDLKKQMKNAAINSSELVTDISDVSDAKMKMDLVKDSSDLPMSEDSPTKNTKSLIIELPDFVDIKKCKELVTAIEDGITPISQMVKLCFKEEDDVRAAQEWFSKVEVDGKAVQMKLIKGKSGKDKKSLFIEVPELMEIEEARQLLTAVDASGSKSFQIVNICYKESDDAKAAQEKWSKVEIDGELLQTMLKRGAPGKDKKSLFIDMPAIIEIENAKKFLSAIEASGAQLFQYLTIVHKEQDEATATQKQLGEVKINGKSTQVEFDHRTPKKDKKSLFIQMTDTMEIENYKQLLTAIETSTPFFQYVTIVHKEEDDAKATYERLRNVEIEGQPIALHM